MTDIPDQYVIRWDIKPKSYFTQMTAIGPAFGGTARSAMRFATEKEAAEMQDRFATVALCGTVIVKVKGRKP